MWVHRMRPSRKGARRHSLLLFLQQPFHVSLSNVSQIASRLASRAPARNQYPPKTSQSFPLMQLALSRPYQSALPMQLALSCELCSVLQHGETWANLQQAAAGAGCTQRSCRDSVSLQSWKDSVSPRCCTLPGSAPLRQRNYRRARPSIPCCITGCSTDKQVGLWFGLPTQFLVLLVFYDGNRIGGKIMGKVYHQ